MNEAQPQLAYTIRSEDWEASYMELYRSGELAKRVELALDRLRDCDICPRLCHVNRLEKSNGVCKTGRHAIVSSFHASFGEEDCLRGWNGSGTIHFARCNLNCVFCHSRSADGGPGGLRVAADFLAGMMIQLQEEGCHNVHLVTPVHVIPQILEALHRAVELGFRLPLVYNTSAYETSEALDLLDGVVDIYLPDFKFWDSERSHRYIHARDYPDVAREALRRMHRQVGDLLFDENGIARQGLLVRHLVMPGLKDETRSILEFLARDLSAHTYLNLMGNYYPAGDVDREQFSELNRRVQIEDYEECVRYASEIGLHRIDVRHSIFDRNRQVL